MARKLPRRLLRHSATIVRTIADPADPVWVEGEPTAAGQVDENTITFPCILFLPGTQEALDAERSWRRRAIVQPMMLYNLHTPVNVDLNKNDRVLITAADLMLVSGADVLLWQVAATPQPFGRPGRVFAAQTTLSRVED